jgi:ribonuclease D
MKDALYLNEIRKLQIEKLKKNRVYDEFIDHCKMAGNSYYNDKIDEEVMWVRLARKAKGDKKIRPYIKCLYNHRLQIAREFNIAPFRIIKDSGLLKIVDELLKRDFTNESFKNYLNDKYPDNPLFVDNSQDLFFKIERQKNEVINKYPNEIKVKLTPSESRQMKFIQNFKIKAASKRGIDPSLILSKKNAKILLRELIDHPRKKIKKKDFMRIFNWSSYKYSLYKNDLQKMISVISENIENQKREKNDG